jgi:hypothetical protein
MLNKFMKRETASMGVDVEERGTTCKSDDLSNMRVATSSRTMFSVRRLRLTCPLLSVVHQMYPRTGPSFKSL